MILQLSSWLRRRLSGKESTCQCRRLRRHEFDPWVRKIPWRRKWQPSPVFLPGKSHGQRSLVGYSPRDHEEPGAAEWLSMITCIQHPLVVLFLKCKEFEKDTLSLCTCLAQNKHRLTNWYPPVFSYSERVCVCLCEFEREVSLLVFFPQNVWGSMPLTE